MRGRVAGFIFFVAALASPSAGAMSASRHASQRHCDVANSAKLPAEAGANLICTEVERAVAAAAPKVRYSVQVQVVSSSRLSATLVVNGRTLPEQNFAVMDRELNPGSIRRFAESLASEVAKAVKE